MANLGPDPADTDTAPPAGEPVPAAPSTLPIAPPQMVTPWMDARRAAQYLGVALGTIRNWTSERFIPHAKRGRLVRYHRDELDRWLAGGSRRGRNNRAN